MSGQQQNGAAAPAKPSEGVNHLLNLLRTLGDKNKQPQKVQQRPPQPGQQRPSPAIQRQIPPTTAATPAYQAQTLSNASTSAQNAYQPYNYTGTLHDALQAQSSQSSPGQGYTAPPLPNIQVGGQPQAGPSRVRFASTPSVAIVPSNNSGTPHPPISQPSSQPLSGPPRSKTNVAQTNMQILQNMFKNTNSQASKRRQNALVGLLESIRSGKGISIGRPSQVRPGTSMNRDGQVDGSRKRRRMETPGTGRYREPYVYDPVPRHSPGSGYGDHEYHSTADDDDEPVGRPFGPWLPSQIGPDGELLPRKRGRQRILTPEEALARRKERNRLAAQESRRRKAQQLSGTVRKVGELGGELEQTKVKYEELTKTHADLQKRFNDLERAHQQLRRDYDILQDQQNQITNAIEHASRLGDDDFDQFSSEDEEEDQSKQDENVQAHGRRGGSVVGSERGDNVISINGVDMNIDEYLAFSLAAAAAAQEDAMEHHGDSDLMQGVEGQGMDENGQGDRTGFEHYGENGQRDDTPIADIHSFGNALSGDGSKDSPIPIDPALQQYTHHVVPEVSRRDPNSIHLPINVDDDDAEVGASTEQDTAVNRDEPPVGASETTDDPNQTERSENQPERSDDLPSDNIEPAAETDVDHAAQPIPAETDSMSVDFDDDEDDGDFVPENELGAGDVDGDESPARTSPASDADAMPAQTQDSTTAQATQGAPDMLEDDDDEDDDEYFRIEEADYEDLLQPIEDVPIPVEDYLEIQAQYQRHLEEFNATLLRQQVAEMIANEDAGAESAAAMDTGSGETAEQQRERERAYQDTLESLGIAPEASRAQE